MESAAATVLKRAVEMDESERYTMALVLYEEGIKILLDSVKETKDAKKIKHFSERASQYLDRAEKVKQLIDKKKAEGKYRELIKIKDGTIGYGYNSMFGRFLNASVTYIRIEDPYIRTFHQCQNLVRFCELAVQKCHSLSKIILITVCDKNDTRNQLARLEEIRASLASRLVDLEVKFSDTLHDRQILFSNGWIVKVGRGLDYFKAPDGKFVLGAHDLELRPCLETTVDIFHTSHVESSNR